MASCGLAELEPRWWWNWQARIRTVLCGGLGHEPCGGRLGGTGSPIS